MDIAYGKLGKICTKIGSGATPTGGSAVYIDDGVSLIRSQNVYNLSFDYNGLAHINDDAARKLQGVTVEEDDVLFNITGDSVARTCVVPKDVIPARVNQHVAIIRTIPTVLNNRFLNYYLASPQMQYYLLALAAGKGASRKAITKEMIEALEIPLPDIETQKQIADVLSQYDIAIENNNKRIKILEQMAENLYKEWFVRFRFPGHEGAGFSAGEPKGWNLIRLEEIINIDRGLSYSSEEIECDEGVDLINLKNIQAYGGFRLDGTKKYSGKYKEQQMVNRGDFVMGVTDMTQDRRTVGAVALIPTIHNLSVISADLIKLSSEYSNVFLYCMFKYGSVSRYISQFANGANVLHLRPQVVNKVKVFLPDRKLIERFAEITQPIFDEIDILNESNVNLVKQRDLLLPRLMSGKLQVM